MDLHLRSVGNWQYVLPCAFFEGENKFLSEVQGWEKIFAKDIVSQPQNHWSRKAVGTATPLEKWAVERIFHHEKTNFMVMTFDILDQGISYMIWWPHGSKEKKYGVAIKIGGHWRIAQENENILSDFESKEIDGFSQITKVYLKFFNKNDGKISAQTVISKDKQSP